MDHSSNINWYPGHMRKTLRQLQDDVRKVDAVLELLDARIPLASRNPDLREIIGDKPHLVLLGRADQADPEITARWRAYFPHSLEVVANQPAGVKKVVPAVQRLLSELLKKYAERGQTGRELKIMVVGIPNVGKSTLINSLTGRGTLKAEDRPGVTRHLQWVRVVQGIDLLDTPGILWPKLGDEATARNLAFTGAIKSEVLDTTELALALMETLAAMYPVKLTERYRIEPQGSGLAMLEAAARKRGYLISGGELDLDRMGLTLLDELQSGKIGRISLEKP